MVLKRQKICQVLGLNSWTAVIAWQDEVVSAAFVELIRDYLAPFAARGERNPPGDTKLHYEHFIVDAIAMDRLSARQFPQKRHLTTMEWAQHLVKLFANMYELTEAICHNYWKTAETEMWPSDDSDVPYTDGEDVPGARL
ncbi:hypothetical protein N658DRAFT_504001 [Parathielavia hyrcaniae]|uniref:Uncharacterized protein n=1 Tax=Parathielavia hyrcaniae TaxID=113614 RepID=A0AAN6T6J9_9PEZI|nr:hypothetical protein N658DRAFT_504001 [Parathielavia hyrcaniae]